LRCTHYNVDIHISVVIPFKYKRSLRGKSVMKSEPHSPQLFVNDVALGSRKRTQVRVLKFEYVVLDFNCAGSSSHQTHFEHECVNGCLNVADLTLTKYLRKLDSSVASGNFSFVVENSVSLLMEYKVISIR
jgi:hypothetical protein